MMPLPKKPPAYSEEALRAAVTVVANGMRHGIINIVHFACINYMQPTLLILSCTKIHRNMLRTIPKYTLLCRSAKNNQQK